MINYSEIGKLGGKQLGINSKNRYYKKPKICPVCGNIIPYEKRFNKTCSWECSYKLRAIEYKEKIEIDNITFICKYCGKECKNLNSLKQHECRCKNNPSKIEIHSSKGIKRNGSFIAWNKGKTKFTDERILLAGIKTSNTLKGRKGHPHTQEVKNHMSELAKKHNLGGHHSSKTFKYKNVTLDSTYELEVAKSLDDNKIKWIRPKYLQWIDDLGKEHRYYADFYLPDYNVYLDPKNDYLIEHINPRFGITDVEKINKVQIQNNVNIIILDSKHLNWDSVENFINKIYS